MHGVWLGYAFLVCRSAAEAAAWRAALDTKELSFEGESLTLKALPAIYKREEQRRAQSEAGGQPASRTRAGEEPTERQVLDAWTRATLRRRAAAAGTTIDALIDAATRGEPSRARLTIGEGIAVPPQLLEALEAALRGITWPAVAQRRGVVSESYLVLRRAIKGRAAEEEYSTLKHACEAVIRWADPDFAYDHLAITKNFVASAHVDKADQSFQFALSLGNFSGGGELCVESADGQRRWRIDTRNRLAKFDGRSAHWVRGYHGNRFSVVWYVNQGRHGRPQSFDVDLDWAPANENDRYTSHTHD